FDDFGNAVTLTASSGTVTQSGSQRGTWSWSGAGDEDSPYAVTITATNADGTTANATFGVSFTDVAPTVVSLARRSITTPEDVPASNSGTFADHDDGLTITASQGTLTDNGDGTWSWAQAGDEADNGTVAVTATNADGSSVGTS